jgi:hypothetical protein
MEKELNQEERPTFLLVLCILSWISIGLGIILGLPRLFSGPLSAEKMKESRVEMLTMMNEMRENGLDGFAEIFEKIQHMTEVFNQHHYAVHTLTFIILLVGLSGVWFMYQGKKLGFHVYIIYSILGIAHVYFFLSPSQVPSILTIWGVLISTAFILMYSRNLHWLK